MDILISGAVGLVAGFVGALSTGAGLVSIPALIFFLGLPTATAIGSTRVGAMGLTLSATYRYHQEKLVDWPLVKRLAPIALIGGLIGPTFVNLIDNEELFQRVVGVIMLLAAPLILKRPFGHTTREPSKKEWRLGFIYFFLAITFGAFFPGGVGTVMIYTATRYFGQTFISANATNLAAWFIMQVVSSAAFIASGLVNFEVAIAFAFTSSIGAWLGAHTAIKKGNVTVQRLLVVVIVIAAIRLLT